MEGDVTLEIPVWLLFIPTAYLALGILTTMLMRWRYGRPFAWSNYWYQVPLIWPVAWITLICIWFKEMFVYAKERYFTARNDKTNPRGSGEPPRQP